MQRFINPYNFISLSDKPERKKETAGEKLTGTITYTLKTKSDLFIPNTSSNKAFAYTPDKEDDPKNEHGLYDFFSYEILDESRTYNEEYFEPVIPGSEVRGMIRSIYETLTNSCLPVLDGEKRIGKRTVEHFKPAVLKRERGRIYLYDAYDKDGRRPCDAVYRNRSDFSEKRFDTCAIPDGMKVYFTKSRPPKAYIKPDVTQMIAASEHRPDRRFETGYLLKGNKGPDIASNRNSKCVSRDGEPCVMLQSGKCPGKDEGGTDHCFLAEKHCAHVFYIPDRGESFQLNDISMETLKIVLEQYMKEDPDSYKEYEASYKRFMNNDTDGLPVYYSKLDGMDYIMLSPACITREVYKNTVNTLVDTYKKCNSVTRELCPACQLFGIVNSNIAQGSKIRFTDLTPSEKAADNRSYYNKKLLTLDPLAVPHPENTEFYLKKPVDPDGEVWFWTYDYYTVKKSDGEVVVKTYQPEISGRKFYWNNLTGIKECEKKTALNRTVRAVRSGVEFTGKVYFDEISEKQLNQLLYILMYTSDGKHGYKLGTGKSLGLGSVEMNVADSSDVSIRMFNASGYISTHKEDLEKIHLSSFKELGLDTRTEKPFELITRYLDEESMRGIYYPKTGETDEEEGFQWFMGNKTYHKYIDREKRIDPNAKDNSPRFRIQTEIRNDLPILENGEIPWLPSNPAANERHMQNQYGTPQQNRYGNTPTSRIVGSVKFFRADQNFGYITGEDNTDYRITINTYNPDIRPEDLKKGCSVTFVPKNLNGKWVANQCRLAE